MRLCLIGFSKEEEVGSVLLPLSWSMSVSMCLKTTVVEQNPLLC